MAKDKEMSSEEFDKFEKELLASFQQIDEYKINTTKKLKQKDTGKLTDLVESLDAYKIAGKILIVLGEIHVPNIVMQKRKMYRTAVDLLINKLKEEDANLIIEVEPHFKTTHRGKITMSHTLNLILEKEIYNTRILGGDYRYLLIDTFHSPLHKLIYLYHPNPMSLGIIGLDYTSERMTEHMFKAFHGHLMNIYRGKTKEDLDATLNKIIPAYMNRFNFLQNHWLVIGKKYENKDFAKLKEEEYYEIIEFLKEFNIFFSDVLMLFHIFNKKIIMKQKRIYILIGNDHAKYFKKYFI